MEYSKKSREELILFCRQNNISGYSGKKKTDIIQLIQQAQANIKVEVKKVDEDKDDNKVTSLS